MLTIHYEDLVREFVAMGDGLYRAALRLVSELHADAALEPGNLSRARLAVEAIGTVTQAVHAAELARTVYQSASSS